LQIGGRVQTRPYLAMQAGEPVGVVLRAWKKNQDAILHVY
jgi:hypothetical protein